MKKKSKKELLMAGGLALEILVVLLFLNARINALLDSDMSSEMVLAQLLAKENAALSTHWYYSTELRVLNGINYMLVVYYNWYLLFLGLCGRLQKVFPDYSTPFTGTDLRRLFPIRTGGCLLYSSYCNCVCGAGNE